MKCLILLLSMSACTWQTDPDPYREKLATDIVADLLIDEYEVRLGDIGERCENHLHSVVYLNRGAKIPNTKLTMGSDNLDVYGEHFYNGTSYIWTDKSLTAMSYNTVLVHEMLHGLLACVSDIIQQGIGDGDGDHNQPGIWCTTGHGCKWDGHDNSDSLEYAVAESVRYYAQETN